MKKVLLMIVGLPRTFEKCAGSLFKNLIIPNKNYEFEIYINTETKQDEKILTDKLNKIYNRFNQVKDISFYKLDRKYIVRVPGSNQSGVLKSYIRTEYICKKNNISKNDSKYEFCIETRMDIILNNKILLDNYKNKFLIVTSSLTRIGHFHNRDWDFMKIGYKNSYYIHDSLQLLTLWEPKHTNIKKEPTDDFNRWLQNKEEINYEHIRNKFNLKGDKKIENTSNHVEICQNYYKIIEYMLDNNYEFILSENENIIATIIRR